MAMLLSEGLAVAFAGCVAAVLISGREGSRADATCGIPWDVMPVQLSWIICDGSPQKVFNLTFLAASVCLCIALPGMCTDLAEVIITRSELTLR